MRLKHHCALNNTLKCLLLILCIQYAGAVPSSTQFELPPEDLVSRDHFFRAPQKPISTLTRWKDSTISTIWNYFGSTARPIRPDQVYDQDGLAPQSHSQYADQLVLRFNISTSEEATSLAEAADVLFLDIWASSQSWVDIRVDKPIVPSLLGLLPGSLQHAHIPLMSGNDLTRAVANTYPQTRSENSHPSHDCDAQTSGWRRRRPAHKLTDDVFFSDYRPLQVIHDWMNLMQSLFPAHVSAINVGSTSFDRPIQAIRLGSRSSNTATTISPRKTILVTAGIHAREWVSTSTTLYLAYDLATAYGNSKTATRLLDEFDWVFVPTLNPDGYAYTWETDRLWRKNRQTTPLRFCKGINLDRTWPYQWNSGTGDSIAALDEANPCSESYAGTEPFAAAESRTFGKWAQDSVDSGNATIVALLDLHSYSEQILYPYSYSCSAIPHNLENLAELGQGLAKAIRGGKGRGQQENYHVLSACEGTVAAAMAGAGAGSGSMLDWFYHDMGVKHAFQIKLRDKGSYGFLLPRGYIVPTGVEILRALKYLGKSLSTSGPWLLDDEHDDDE